MAGRRKPTVLLILVLGAWITPALVADTVALVQFEVRKPVFQSWQTFEREIDRIVHRATLEVPVTSPLRLVVFPEYVNVPILFVPFADALEQAATVGEALSAVGESSLSALVHRRARESYDRIVAMWSQTARRHNVAILAGTAFAPAGEHGEEIRNRALLFDTEGTLVYTQDKVFLTPFEQHTLDLAAGHLDQAESFSVGSLRGRITICRDTFFEAWDAVLPEADLWIDIRANGEPYSADVRERFKSALPERVAATDAVAGVNASLTGEYLDLMWAGHAFVVDEGGNRVAETPKPTGTTLLFANLTHDASE